MDITIIIVNWNGGDLLHRCLQSIRASRSSFAVKVIVVDNDSKDGSREAAQAAFPEFDIFNSGSNLGFGRANNLARSRVTTPLVLFLNPDTELREDTLERCVQCLREHPDIGVLGCKMRYPTGEIQEQGIQWMPSPWTLFLEMVLITERTFPLFRRWIPTIDPHRSGYVRKLYGGFLLCHRDVLDRAGWFDDRYFMYAEDVDLCRTVTDNGSRLYYLAEAEIMHVAGGTSAKAPSGFSLLMKSESIHKYMRKYYGPLGALAYRFVVLVSALLRLVVALPTLVITRLLAPSRSSRFSSATIKCRSLIAWALGLQRARPAGSR